MLLPNPDHMLVALLVSVIINLCLIYFIAKRFYYGKVPPVLWDYDIALLGDSHVYRGKWNQLLGLRVANFGKGGDTIEQIYHRVPGVINCKPKICFIHGGINDLIKEVPHEKTIAYYKKIIADLRTVGITPVMIGVMKPGYSYLDNQIEQLNAELKTLASFIEVEITPDDLSPDGLHMQGSGYIKWAAAIKNFTQ